MSVIRTRSYSWGSLSSRTRSYSWGSQSSAPGVIVPGGGMKRNNKAQLTLLKLQRPAQYLEQPASQMLCNGPSVKREMVIVSTFQSCETYMDGDQQVQELVLTHPANTAASSEKRTFTSASDPKPAPSGNGFVCVSAKRCPIKTAYLFKGKCSGFEQL